MMKKINIILIVLISLIGFACDPGSDVANIDGDLSTCEGCHTSKEAMQQYASGTVSGGTGGG